VGDRVTKVHPLFADGPLAGKDIAVDEYGLRSGFQAIDLSVYHTPLTWPLEETVFRHRDDIVTYRFQKCMIFGFPVWIGAVKPFERLTAREYRGLFEQLVSGRGFAAGAR
jgi:hypothetical protein